MRHTQPTAADLAFYATLRAQLDTGAGGGSALAYAEDAWYLAATPAARDRASYSTDPEHAGPVEVEHTAHLYDGEASQELDRYEWPAGYGVDA